LPKPVDNRERERSRKRDSAPTHTGRRQRKRVEERFGWKSVNLRQLTHTSRWQRKRERKRDPAPMHTGQRQRKREEERSGRKSTHTGRISLCQPTPTHAHKKSIDKERERKRNPAENPHTSAGSLSVNPRTTYLLHKSLHANLTA
jgi:hypothetical protein